MYLGIDIGTSGVKAVLDEHGAVAAQALAPLPVPRPHPGWSEQDPDAWWPATTAAVTALAGAAPAGGARRRLVGQMHGATLLDAADQPLRPAILWNDGRSEAECAELEAARAAEPADHRQHRHAGLHRAQAALGRASTSRRSSRATRTVLLPKDYVRLRMTGEKASDMSDAAGTLWLDVGERALVRRDARGDAVSPKRTCRGCTKGRNRPARCAPRSPRPGAWRACPVAGGGGDNAAGAVGVGVIRPTARRSFRSARRG